MFDGETDGCAGLSQNLAIDCGTDEIEDVGDDARGWIVGYDVAVIVTVLVTGRRGRNLGIICTGDRLKAVVGRNALTS